MVKLSQLRSDLGDSHNAVTLFDGEDVNVGLSWSVFPLHFSSSSPLVCCSYYQQRCFFASFLSSTWAGIFPPLSAAEVKIRAIKSLSPLLIIHWCFYTEFWPGAKYNWLLTGEATATCSSKGITTQCSDLNITEIRNEAWLGELLQDLRFFIP